jgi:hypothetical protein
VTAIALFTLSTIRAIFNLILGSITLGENIDIPFDNLDLATDMLYIGNKCVTVSSRRSLSLIPDEKQRSRRRLGGESAYFNSSVHADAESNPDLPLLHYLESQ